MKREGYRSNIPEEIANFFSNEGGRSLLVEGSAGTGKTTLALQILEELGEIDRSFYLTTRVSDDALYSQFPWLKEKEMKSRIIDSSRVLLETLYKPEPEKKPAKEEIEELKRVTTAREFLKSISKERKPPTKVDRARLSILQEQNKLPEIERMYERIESVLPNKAMLVIDSVEGVTHKYGMDTEEFVNALQKDLVEASNTNLLLVLEKVEASHIEYIVDGVVTVSETQIDRRRIREITLTKLRATEIRQPRYLITLRNGRFKSLEPFEPDFSSPRTWEPLGDSRTHYSTGIPDLDNLLGGGLRRGSYNVIEVADNVTSEDYHSIVRPVLLNFISQNRGVLAILAGGDHGETLRSDMTRFLPKDQFNKYVRIGDYFMTQSSEPYIMALNIRKEDVVRVFTDNMALLRGRENRPILEYSGLDTLEYLRGGDVAIKDLLGAVAQTKISQDLGLGILKPGLKMTQEIINMADTYLRIIDVNKCPCVYGIKPKTIVHAIVVDRERGSPWVKLVPIV